MRSHPKKDNSWSQMRLLGGTPHLRSYRPSVYVWLKLSIICLPVWFPNCRNSCIFLISQNNFEFFSMITQESETSHNGTIPTCLDMSPKVDMAAHPSWQEQPFLVKHVEQLKQRKTYSRPQQVWFLNVFKVSHLVCKCVAQVYLYILSRCWGGSW